MLIRRIVPNQQNCRRVQHIAHGSGASRLAVERRRQGRVVGGAVMIELLVPSTMRAEFRKKIILFVGSTVGSDHADAPPPSISRASRNRIPISSNASSQVAGVSFPFLRTSGCVRRSACCAKSKAKRPLTHRKSPLIPVLSRLSPRTISMPVSKRRTPE